MTQAYDASKEPTEVKILRALRDVEDMLNLISRQVESRDMDGSPPVQALDRRLSAVEQLVEALNISLGDIAKRHAGRIAAIEKFHGEEGGDLCRGETVSAQEVARRLNVAAKAVGDRFEKLEAEMRRIAERGAAHQNLWMSAERVQTENREKFEALDKRITDTQLASGANAKIAGLSPEAFEKNYTDNLLSADRHFDDIFARLARIEEYLVQRHSFRVTDPAGLAAALDQDASPIRIDPPATTLVTVDRMVRIVQKFFNAPHLPNFAPAAGDEERLARHIVNELGKVYVKTTTCQVVDEEGLKRRLVEAFGNMPGYGSDSREDYANVAVKTIMTPDAKSGIIAGAGPAAEEKFNPKTVIVDNREQLELLPDEIRAFITEQIADVARSYGNLNRRDPVRYQRICELADVSHKKLAAADKILLGHPAK